jgi:hypothetical protein
MDGAAERCARARLMLSRGPRDLNRAKCVRPAVTDTLHSMTPEVELELTRFDGQGR